MRGAGPNARRKCEHSMRPNARDARPRETKSNDARNEYDGKRQRASKREAVEHASNVEPNGVLLCLALGVREHRAGLGRERLLPVRIFDARAQAFVQRVKASLEQQG